MQTPAVVLNIGADVAKDEIVVACSEGSFPVRQVANQRPALLAFLKGLPAGSRIGVESTGTYHELFAGLAIQLGFLVFLLNPKDTRHYAKAVGLRGKTDRVDAELIARMDRSGPVSPRRQASTAVRVMSRIREYRACPIATPHSEVLERGTAKQVRAHDLHTPHRKWLTLRVNRTDPSWGPRTTGGTSHSFV